MRILIASNFYSPFVVGGAELIAEYLATWFAQNGHDVTVVSTCDPVTGSSDTRESGVRVLRFFPPNLWWNFERFAAGDRRGKVARAVWNLRDGWNRRSGSIFGSILDDVRPDIVHTHNIKGLSPTIWGQAAQRSIPIVHTAHDYHLICQSGTMTSHGRECRRSCLGCRAHARWYTTRATATNVFCSPSRFVLDRHKACGVLTDGQLLVVPNGVPGVPHYRPLRTPAPAVRLLFLGQLRKEKGAHLLPLIAKQLGPAARIDIAGAGPLRDDLVQAAENDARLVLHGFLGAAEKQTLLDAADALVFPSTWTENAPLVLTEAFMRGLPVIASRLGAIPEFVQDGMNGLLVEAGNAGAFANAAQRLWREAGLHGKLSAGATETASRCTVAEMGQRYLTIYRTQVAAVENGRSLS